MRWTPSAVLVLALALTAACRSATPPGVYFDTRPGGAEVAVDGKPTGFVTPCMIALDEDRAFRVSLTLAGFEPRLVHLLPADRAERIPWSDGVAAPNGFRSPLALSASDLFIPYVRNEAHAPSRIFLRMIPAQRADGTID